MTVQPLGRDIFGRLEDKDSIITREEAAQIVTDWITNDRLRLHCRQVAGLMEGWARHKLATSELEIEKWYLAGLLHDADWEKYPELHCQKIIELLESKHISPEILHAIASHSPRYFGVEPISDMDKMIYAFDELSGFIHAYSLMRGGYDGMEVKGVTKKLKDKAFASGVDRSDVYDAAEKSGTSLEDIIQFVIENQKSVA
jgi:predicted hydrolase (HD superfamily)